MEDVLADDVVLAEGVVVEAAVAALARQREVLPDGHLVHVERGVHPQAPPLQPGERRGPILIEEIERHEIRVVLSGSRNREVRVAELSGAEHRLPPVGPGAARNDQDSGPVIGAQVHIRAGAGARLARHLAAVGPDVFGNPGVVPESVVAVDVRGNRQAGVEVAGLHHLEVVQRVLDEERIIPADRGGHAGPDVQGHVVLPRPPPLRLDDDDAVACPRAVDRSGRGILQDLDGPDFVRVQPVEVGVLHGRPVHDVERIVVLERGDAPDAHRGARPRRPAVLDGHTGHTAVEALQHAGRRLFVGARQVDAGHGARDVGSALGGVAGHDHRIQHGDDRFQRDVDAGPSGDGARRAPIADDVVEQHAVPGSRERVLPVVARHGPVVRPTNLDGDSLQRRTRCRGDDARDLELLGNRRSAQHRRQQQTEQRVFHGVLILWVCAWPSGPAWRSARDTW